MDIFVHIPYFRLLLWDVVSRVGYLVSEPYSFTSELIGVIEKSSQACETRLRGRRLWN